MKSGWPLDARHWPQSLFHRICLQSNTLVACAHRGCLPVCHAGSATARGSGSRSAFYPWALAQTSSTNSLDGRSEHVVAGAGCSARPAGRDGRPTLRIGRAGRSIRSWDLMGAGSSQLRRDGCWLAPRPLRCQHRPLRGQIAVRSERPPPGCPSNRLRPVGLPPRQSVAIRRGTDRTANTSAWKRGRSPSPGRRLGRSSDTAAADRARPSDLRASPRPNFGRDRAPQ